MNLKNIDFNKIPSLSKEILEKLNKFKPENLYDAGKISGITPSALFQIIKHKKIKGIKIMISEKQKYWSCGFKKFEVNNFFKI